MFLDVLGGWESCIIGMQMMFIWAASLDCVRVLFSFSLNYWFRHSMLLSEYGRGIEFRNI